MPRALKQPPLDNTFIRSMSNDDIAEHIVVYTGRLKANSEAHPRVRRELTELITKLERERDQRRGARA